MKWYVWTVGRPTVPELPLTTTTTTQHDDGHYANIQRSDEPDYYNYLEFNQPTSDDHAVEQRQRPSGNYEQLDPSVLATLHRPPAPSVYARLSPSTSHSSHVINTEPGDTNPTNHERADPASSNEFSVTPEYAGVSGTLPITGSHDYRLVIANLHDGNGTSSILSSTI